MPKVTPLQTNFSSGETAPGLRMRVDTQQYHDGAKSLRNRRCLIEGGTCRRPGSLRSHILPGPCRMAEFVVKEDTRYLVAFSAGRADFYRETDGTLVAAGALTACPWTGDLWETIDWAQSANTMFVVHPEIYPQVITRTGVDTWTLSMFGFYIGGSGRVHQPYYATEPNIKLFPGARVGITTLFADTPLFDAFQIDARFRYHGKEMRILSVTDSQNATIHCIEELPLTQYLTLVVATGKFINSGSFHRGDIIAGSASGARGKVTDIDNSTRVLVVIIIDGATKFIAGGGGDEAVGPNGRAQVEAVSDAPFVAGDTDWDEQLISARRGFPSTVELHRNRLCFAGHPFVPSAIITSKPTNLYDFDVGTGNDGDAIFETIGDAGAAEILQLHSAEQLLILTDGGPYYVPESLANPFRPSGMSFMPFGSPWALNPRTRARSFDGGVIMTSGSLVIKAKPTGDLQHMWAAEEVSLLASHLIKSPVDLAVVTNFNGGVERYALITNNDGTMAVMMLVEDQKLRNFTPWETAGSYRAIACLGGVIYAYVERMINDATVHFLETFSHDIMLDLATVYADETEMLAATASYGTGVANVVVKDTTWSLGTYPLQQPDPPAGPYVVGLFYDSTVQTLPPSLPEGVGMGERMRIWEALIFVRESARFAANGYEVAAYQVADDLGAPPPLRNGPVRFNFLGWEYEPTITITQPDPLPLTIDAIKMKVATNG